MSPCHGEDRGFESRLARQYAVFVQWQYLCLPSRRRRFESVIQLQTYRVEAVAAFESHKLDREVQFLYPEPNALVVQW